MQRPTAIFRLKLATVLAGSALLLDVANAATPQFNAVDIGSLGGSSGADIDSKQSWWYGTTASAYTIANGINNSGQVVGVSVTTMFDAYGLPVHHAFLYSGATMTDLGTLIGPTNNSVAYAINNSTQVVGQSDAYVFYDGIYAGIGGHAFLYSGGTMTDVGTFFDTYFIYDMCGSWATAINANGQVVETAMGYGDSMGFLYDSGATTLVTAYAEGNSAFGINNSTQIVGQAYTGYGAWDAAFYTVTNDVVQTSILGINLWEQGGYAWSSAYAINNNSQFVGWSQTNRDGSTPNASHAFVCSGVLHNGGTITDLGTLRGGTFASASGINDNGQIVGVCYLSDNVTMHAFLCSTNSGTMLDLNNLLANSIDTYLTEAFGINVSGQIIANGANGHAYLLTPASQVTPPAPPEFLSITLTGDTVSFTWGTIPGETYQVQYNSDLTSTNWNDLGNPVYATGTTLSATDALTPPQRFYRVLMQ